MNKKSLVNNAVSSVALISGFFLCILFSSLTADYSLDRVFDSAYPYLTSSNQKLVNPSFLTIAAKNEDAKSKRYDDLVQKYHYDIKVDSIRQRFENNCLVSLGSEGLPLTLLTQKTFSMFPMDDGFWRLDYNLFHTYYGETLLGPRGYLVTRFDCTAPAYISDSLAEKLANLYGFAHDPERYKKIIENKEYAVLPINIDGVGYSLCINDIISTTRRSGRRTADVCGDFALVYNEAFKQSKVKLAFDIDLKINAGVNKDLLREVANFGYKPDSHSFSLMCYSEGSYKCNVASSRLIEDSFFAGPQWPYVAGIVLSSIMPGAVFALLHFFNRSPFGKQDLLWTLGTLGAIALFFVCSNYFYAYTLWGIPIMVYLAVMVCLRTGGLIKYVSKTS